MKAGCQLALTLPVRRLFRTNAGSLYIFPDDAIFQTLETFKKSTASFVFCLTVSLIPQQAVFHAADVVRRFVFSQSSSSPSISCSGVVNAFAINLINLSRSSPGMALRVRLIKSIKSVFPSDCCLSYIEYPRESRKSPDQGIEALVSQIRAHVF